MGKYFDINELCASDAAVRAGIDNAPSHSAKEKMAILIAQLLDPVRESWGKPIKVTSGFRSPILNRLVGGASNSQHIQGEAADITAGNPKENKILFEIIRTRFEFDQLIDEQDYTWLHISYREGQNRCQALHL